MKMIKSFENIVCHISTFFMPVKNEIDSMLITNMNNAEN